MARTGSDTVIVDRPTRRVLRVRLNRPGRRNAFDAALLDGLRSALGAPDEPVAILGSTDPRAFSAGGDLSLPPEELAAVSDGLYDLYEHLVALPTVIIAAADGHAIGAGAQLLLCADLRVGGQRLRISFAGGASGLALGTWGLPGMVGRGPAFDLTLTGRSVDTAEALRLGLLDRVASDPDAEAVALAIALAGARPDVLRRAKRLMMGRTDLVSGIRAERDANATSHHTAAGSRYSDPTVAP